MAPPRDPRPPDAKPGGTPTRPPPKKGDPGYGTAPPAPPTGLSSLEKYRAWAKKLGLGKTLADNIWSWAHTYAPAGAVEAFAYYFASIIKAESGGQHLDKNGNVKSSGQALGVAQIAFSHIGDPVPWDPSRRVTLQDLQDPGFNLRFGAYLYGNAVANNGFAGSYTEAGGYNPKDPNRFKAWQAIKDALPAGLFAAPSQGPGQTPGAGGPPNPKTTDPWVMGINKKGKLVLSFDQLPPKGVVMWDGLALTRSDFLREKRGLEDLYMMYTGGRPSDKQIMEFINGGWSDYYLRNKLSHDPRFKNSPIMKSGEGGGGLYYQTAAQDFLPRGGKIDPEMLRNAIVNKWDASVLQSELRKKPAYLQSNQFSSDNATLQTVYSTIYGRADKGAMATIANANLAGWKPDQFASWLRSQDQYVFTGEYRDKGMRLMEALGMMTGAVPTLTEKNAPGERPGTATPLPTDPRVDDKAGLPPGPYMVGGMRGDYQG